MGSSDLLAAPIRIKSQVDETSNSKLRALVQNKQLFLFKNKYVLFLFLPVTPKCLLWQMVKTQMKCYIVCGISSGSTLFATEKD